MSNKSTAPSGETSDSTGFSIADKTIDLALKIAIGDMVGNIRGFKDGLLEERAPCLLAGLAYDTPWTRDAAFNTWFGLGVLAPGVARNTLWSVLMREENGDVRIGGQYWDAIIWAHGVWQYFLYTGDRSILETALEAVTNSLVYFEKTEFDSRDGLFRGGACFQDGVAGYPDYFAPAGAAYSGIMNWVETSGLASKVGGGITCKALSTNCLYYRAYQVAGFLAKELKRAEDPAWAKKAELLRTAINARFWQREQGRYAYLIDAPDIDDRQEGLGLAFALLFGVADDAQAKQIFDTVYLSPHGMPCVWPTYDRYAEKKGEFGRHSGTIWPQVNAAWALACHARGRSDLAQRELLLLAEKAVRDSEFAEVYHPESGIPYGGLQEEITGRIESYHVCHRQSWCASGYLGMVLFCYFNIEVTNEKPLTPLVRAKLAALVPQISY